mgnify:CR=1 FL=1
MKKYFLLLIFLLIPLISADLIVTYPDIQLHLFPVVLIVEFIAFLILTDKVFKIKLSFWKSLLIIAVVNIITSIIGLLIYFINVQFIYGVLIAFVLSVIIEFGVILLFFINNKNAKKINLFWISLIINALSYLIVLIIDYYL